MVVGIVVSVAGTVEGSVGIGFGFGFEHCGSLALRLAVAAVVVECTGAVDRVVDCTAAVDRLVDVAAAGRFEHPFPFLPCLSVDPSPHLGTAAVGMVVAAAGKCCLH